MYCITERKNTALDIAAHEEVVPEVIKHPTKDLWAVEVSSDNKYLSIVRYLSLVESLHADWGG